MDPFAPIEDYRGDLPERDWRSVLPFRLFGRSFEIRSDITLRREDAYKVLPVNAILEEECGPPSGVFSLVSRSGDEDRGLYWNSALLNGIEDYHLDNLEVLDCKFQYAFALAFSGEMLFLHAGAVSADGNGILIPGDTRSGKTTLVKGFLEGGCRYLAEDCAVVDRDGRIHPYVTPLKIRKRPGSDDRVHRDPEAFGTSPEDGPKHVTCVLFSSYRDGSVWEPEPCEPGESSWRLLEKLFYSPAIRTGPAETLGTIARIAESAVCLKGERGEATEVVSDVLNRLEDRD